MQVTDQTWAQVKRATTSLLGMEGISRLDGDGFSVYRHKDRNTGALTHVSVTITALQPDPTPAPAPEPPKPGRARAKRPARAK